MYVYELFLEETIFLSKVFFFWVKVFKCSSIYSQKKRRDNVFFFLKTSINEKNKCRQSYFFQNIIRKCFSFWFCGLLWIQLLILGNARIKFGCWKAFFMTITILHLYTNADSMILILNLIQKVKEGIQKNDKLNKNIFKISNLVFEKKSPKILSQKIFSSVFFGNILSTSN